MNLESFFRHLDTKTVLFLKFLMDLCFEMVPLWRSDNDLAISSVFTYCIIMSLLDFFHNP